jgi:hypothetical protein
MISQTGPAPAGNEGDDGSTLRRASDWHHAPNCAGRRRHIVAVKRWAGRRVKTRLVTLFFLITILGIWFVFIGKLREGAIFAVGGAFVLFGLLKKSPRNEANTATVADEKGVRPLIYKELGIVPWAEVGEFCIADTGLLHGWLLGKRLVRAELRRPRYFIARLNPQNMFAQRVHLHPRLLVIGTSRLDDLGLLRSALAELQERYAISPPAPG